MAKTRISPDGWLTTRGDNGETIHVRARWEAGNYVVTDVLISAPEITAATLRRVQPARIVAGAQVPGVRGDPFNDPLLAALYQPKSDERLTLGALRNRQPAPAPTWNREPLPRPDGSDPDAFYLQVVSAYRSAAAESNAPIKILAEEAGVPAETVRRWVKEARRRHPEALGAGRKGRAG